MIERFQKQSRHWLTREEELRRQQQARARRAGRTKRQRDDWDVDDEDPQTFARMGGNPPVPRRGEPRERDDLRRGTVTAVHAGRVEVDFAPARLGAALATDPQQRLAVGDEVAFEPTAGPMRVVAREPRRSVLARPDPGNEHRELVLAANVDVGVVVVATQEPPLRPGLVDRFLVALERGGIAPLVCVNKVDLLDTDTRGAVATTMTPYVELAVPVLWCSAGTGAGIDDLRERLRGRTCVFVGHSGVGKSSLLNALDPDGARAVGAVRGHDGKGRHTTTSASMRQLADGTRVVDTPGIRAFGLGRLSAAELRAAFPELLSFAAHCRFADCTHAVEPDCAVRAAAAAGRLSAARLQSYLRLLAETEADGP